MAIYKIQNGFSIVDSNNVEGQQIDGIKTSIAASPSDSKLATEKAVKTYVDAHSGAVQSVSDTDSVDLSVDGNGDLTADVQISSATGNTVQIISTSGEEGLFVPASEGDHKTQVSSADAIPNYLYDKIETFDTPSGLIRKGIHGNVDGSKTLQLGIDATSATNGQVLTAEDIDGVCFPKWKNPTGGMTNPMTAANDLIIGGVSGAPSRLASGTTGQVLKVGSSGLEWANESAGMTNPMTTAGDIIVGGTSGAPSRLGVGSSGQVLKVGANGIEWGAETGQALYLGAFDSRNRPQTATTGQFILDTDLGYILYRYGSAWINSTGTVYEGSVTPSTDTPVRWMENPMTTAGDVIVGGTDGAPSRLGAGTDGEVLTMVSGAPTWAAGGIKCTDTIPYCCIEGTFSLAANTAYALAFVPTQDIKINKIRLYGTFPSGQYRAAVYLSNSLYSYSATSTELLSQSNTVIMDIPDTTIPLNGGCWLAFCGNAASTIRGKSGGLNNFSRSQSISLWNWPTTPTGYGTAMTDVAYFQIWYE